MFVIGNKIRKNRTNSSFTGSSVGIEKGKMYRQDDLPEQCGKLNFSRADPTIKNDAKPIG